MPLPFVWLGAAVVSAIAVKEFTDDRKDQQRQRKQQTKVQTFVDLQRDQSPVAIYPSDILPTEAAVTPHFGAIVCCGIGGVLEHTGIWIGDDAIVELDGEGLIKPVSAARFTKHRSGQKIFIACDSKARPLVCEKAAEKAISQLFKHVQYHMFDNNCHQFIGQCFSEKPIEITTFKTLNYFIAEFFDRQIYWDVCAC